MAHIIAMGSNSTRGNVDADAHKLVVALHEVFNHVDEECAIPTRFRRFRSCLATARKT